MTALVEQCMAEYDEDGWTGDPGATGAPRPDLSAVEDLKPIAKNDPVGVTA